MQITKNKYGYYYEVVEKSNHFLAMMYFHHTKGLECAPKHWHHSVEISCYVNSDMTLWINGETRIYPKNSIVLINSDEVHEILPHTLENPLGVTIVFPYEILKEYNINIDEGHFLKNAGKIWDEQLLHHLHTIINYSYLKDQGDPYYFLLINSEIFSLMHLLISHYYVKYDEEHNYNPNYWKRCIDILTFIDEEYSNNITLDCISKHFGMSKEHFSRIFKQYLGITYKTHLTSIRLMHAYHDLLESKSTIIDIALSNGFPDYRSFINSFKKRFGVTPYQYRQLNNSKDPIPFFPFPS